jgi:hypothetical protein
MNLGNTKYSFPCLSFTSVSLIKVFAFAPIMVLDPRKHYIDPLQLRSNCLGRNEKQKLKTFAFSA